MSGSRPDYAREIIRFLAERMNARREEDPWADIADIERHLSSRGLRISRKTIHRLLSGLESSPRIDEIARELSASEAPHEDLVLYRLVARREGRRRLYRLVAFRIRGDDLRYREEMRELRRWRERLEEEYGLLGRLAVLSDIEPRVRGILRSAARQWAGELTRLTWAHAAEHTADYLEGAASPDIRRFFDGVLRSFRPDLFEWRKEPDPDRAPEDFRKLASRLKEELPAESRLLMPVEPSSDPFGGARGELRCATDATLLRAEWFPMEIFLGAARLEIPLRNDLLYAYSTEPPLSESERAEPPRDIDYLHMPEADEEDEYERRARRSRLDRIHYRIENDVLSGSAHWLGGPPNALLPALIIHDGRILPELLRSHDFLADEEEGGSAARYAAVNRRTFEMFFHTHTSLAAVGRIIGMVKMERFPLPALLLTGALLGLGLKNGLEDPDVSLDAVKWIMDAGRDIRFFLHLITGLIGSGLWDGLGGRPFLIAPFPRPVSAFQEMSVDRLERLIEKHRERDPRMAEFLKETYKVLIDEGVIWYLYCVPLRLGEEQKCFPRFEVLQIQRVASKEQVLTRAQYALSALVREDEWEIDERHGRESKYGLMVPRIARDVDKGALIAGEELRRLILERIEEIRRAARARGYPF